MSIAPSERHDEKLFRLLVERVKDYAIFMLDIEGRVLSWNAGAQFLKGYTAAEIIGRSFETFYPEESKREGLPRRLLDLAKRDGRTEHEGWRVRKDGSRFWAHIVITAIRNEVNELVGFGKVTHDLTERRAAELALRQAYEELEQRVEERTKSLEDTNRALRHTNEELQRSREVLQDKIRELELFHEVVVGRELKMIELEREVAKLQEEVRKRR